MGGNGIINPLSLATVVVIKKKVNNRNAMSAIDAFGISGFAAGDAEERAQPLPGP